MIKIGTWNHLEILREIAHGLVLDGEDEGDILMPSKYKPAEWAIGDDLFVFVYPDSDDRLVATTETPIAKVDDFALLECVDVNKVGAFVNIGLTKDILVPYREQEERMQAGYKYVVKIYLDKVSMRLVGTTKIYRWLDRGTVTFAENQEVELMIIEKTEIGYKAMVNQIDVGLIYNKEIFQPIKIGDKMQGYVVATRPDGKIDLSLHKPAVEKVDDLTDRILAEIEKNDGLLELTDKSDPEDIYDTFQSSKKTFKRAVGSLYKQKLITISEEGMRIHKG